jgi:hypothetical protein
VRVRVRVSPMHGFCEEVPAPVAGPRVRSDIFNQADLDLAQDLVDILQTFQDITLQVSTRRGAQISQVVVFIDQITSHLLTVIRVQQEVYPPSLRNSCRAGLQLTNKYYTLTDCLPLY